VGGTAHRLSENPRLDTSGGWRNDPDFTRWISDVICGHRAQYQQFNLSLAPLGVLNTLAERIQEEVVSSHAVVPWLALVGAWCRTQTTY
jgi:hypothetical protein